MTMTTTILAYFLIAFYLCIERLLRQGDAAKSLTPGKCDRGSSRLLWAVGIVNLLLVLLASLLNFYGIGTGLNGNAAWCGIALMLIGLVIRYLAAVSLGRYYTRTLQVLDDHQVVDRGLYKLIRHPAYLGVTLLEIGAGLAVRNWGILAFIAVAGILSKMYRIQIEEEMLRDQLGDAYTSYCQKTWRLVPFLY